jgi:hypothetical protein
VRNDWDVVLQGMMMRHPVEAVLRRFVYRGPNVMVRMVAAGLCFVVFSCKQSGDFQGGSERGAKRESPPVAEKPTSPGPEEQQCTQSKLVGVRSVSSFINQMGSTKSFDLELTFQPCPKQQGSHSLRLTFDLDAYMQFYSQTDKSIPIQLLVYNSPQAAGKLRQIKGADFFGKSCSACFFFESDTPLLASPDLTSAVVRLSLDSFAVLAPVSSVSRATQNFTVPLRVRVGDTPPVTGQLTFSPPPRLN